MIIFLCQIKILQLNMLKLLKIPTTNRKINSEKGYVKVFY